MMPCIRIHFTRVPGNYSLHRNNEWIKTKIENCKTGKYSKSTFNAGNIQIFCIEKLKSAVHSYCFPLKLSDSKLDLRKSIFFFFLIYQLIRLYNLINRKHESNVRRPVNHLLHGTQPDYALIAEKIQFAPRMPLGCMFIWSWTLSTQVLLKFNTSFN